MMLKKELENNLNVSNIEMDKKLLEVASKMQKEEFELKQKMVQVQEPVEEPDVDDEEEVEVEPKKQPKKTTSTRKKTTRRTTRSHTRTPRRKIDSDIIGGINFD